MNRVRSIATSPLRFYQRCLSRFKPAMCRFSPTCSQYAIEAIEIHGLVHGFGLALWRVLRCQPLCKGGYDPVPPSKRERAQAEMRDESGVDSACASKRTVAHGERP